VISKSAITVFHRTDGDDIARRAAEHLLRLAPHRANFVRTPAVLEHRDHAGLGDNDAAPFCVDERIGGAEIDREVAREPAEDRIQQQVTASGTPLRSRKASF